MHRRIPAEVEHIRMTIESSQLRGSAKPHLDEAKQQIVRFFDKELALLAEERNERARRLGIDRVLPESHLRRSA